MSQRPSSIITVGPIRFDTLRSEVSVNDKTVRLTPGEARVLHLLAVNVNNVCTASQIIAHAWGPSYTEDTVLLKIYIRQLCWKIEPDPNNPTYILTVPNVGYKLVWHESGQC